MYIFKPAYYLCCKVIQNFKYRYVRLNIFEEDTHTFALTAVHCLVASLTELTCNADSKPSSCAPGTLSRGLTKTVPTTQSMLSHSMCLEIAKTKALQSVPVTKITTWEVLLFTVGSFRIVKSKWYVRISSSIPG